MAILSNINGLFAVEDNGAIKFNNLTGTNNQVLIANTGASPTWVDVSTIIGGPYLPLTGGTLAGAGNLVVGGTLTVNGVTTLNSNATFSGDLTMSSGAINSKNLLFSGATIPAANTPSINLRDSNNEFYFQSGSAHVFNFIRYDNRNSMMNIESTGISVTGGGIFSGSITGTTATFSGSGTILSLNRNAPGTALIELKIANTIEGYLGATTTKNFVVYNEAGSEKAHVENNGNIGLYGSAINFLIGDFAEINFRESGAITIDSDNNQSSRNFQFKDGSGSILMLIEDTGNIGIGIDGPDSRLTVSSGTANNVANFKSSDGTAYIALSDNSSSSALDNQIGVVGDNMYFATGDVERMRITSAGQLQLQGSSSSLAKSTTQTEWAYIPGNTNASLMSENPSGMSSASAGYHIVYGANNSSPYQAFIDVITYKCGSLSTSVTTVSSTNISGSPGSRVYSKTANAVILNISGLGVNYNCNVKTTFINYPH